MLEKSYLSIFRKSNFPDLSSVGFGYWKRIPDNHKKHKNSVFYKKSVQINLAAFGFI